MVSKYCDHLPLYRLEQIFQQRHEVYLPRQTLCRWIEVAADWCKLIHEQIGKEIFAAGYIEIDETPIKSILSGCPSSLFVDVVDIGYDTYELISGQWALRVSLTINDRRLALV